MVFIIVWSAAAFLGVMIPTIAISLAPKFTINILERFGPYEPGRLYTMKVDTIADHGSRGRANAYFVKLPGGQVQSENGRVFGWLFLLTTALMVVVALVFTVAWLMMGS